MGVYKIIMNVGLLLSQRVRIFILPIILVMWAGCAPLISSYDAVSYKNLTDLKAEMMVFLDKVDSSQPYVQYRKGFEDLRLEIEKVYEYEKGKGLNEDTVVQVEELRTIFLDLMRSYRQQNTVSQFYLEEKIIQLKDALDTMIKTESAKPK